MGSRPSPIGKISCQAQRGIALDARVDVCRAALGVAQRTPGEYDPRIRQTVAAVLNGILSVSSNDGSGRSHAPLARRRLET